MRCVSLLMYVSTYLLTDVSVETLVLLAQSCVPVSSSMPRPLCRALWNVLQEGFCLNIK